MAKKKSQTDKQQYTMKNKEKQGLYQDERLNRREKAINVKVQMFGLKNKQSN